MSSEAGPGLPPLTPDDVPDSDRWRCRACGTLTRPGMRPRERLLGGWVRVHCPACGDIRIAVPVLVPPQESTSEQP